jgi:aspartyl/asparaginyl beta-hydroxylase (cupin superfamily)
MSILPINLAIVHPKNCEMFVGDKLVPWQEGKVMMINISERHAFFNHSSKDRIHMIANVVLGNRTKEFCDMLVRCYNEQYGKI